MIAMSAYWDLIAAVLPDPEPADLPILDAGGLVLAADVVARLPVPPFDNSAMDGFAVRATDVSGAPVELPVIADIPAGASGPVLLPGRAIRIMTGAPLPAGADAIVPIELTDHGRTDPVPQRVAISEAVPVGSHVRRCGEDTMPGELVLAAGTVLTPAAVAAAISVGAGTVSAYRAPRVAVISTGSELVPPGTDPGPGQIPDSNSALLELLARGAGAEVVARVTATDDEAALAAALAACAGADLVVTSGGVSVGAYDVLRTLDLNFQAVAMQPGKRQACGLVDVAGRGVPLIALPGNPVSVLVSFHAFVAPAIAHLAGRTFDRASERATTRVGWRSPAGRRQFMPGLVHDGVFEPTHRLGSGSHLIASAHRANALAIVPEDVTEVLPETSLEVWRI